MRGKQLVRWGCALLFAFGTCTAVAAEAAEDGQDARAALADGAEREAAASRLDPATPLAADGKPVVVTESQVRGVSSQAGGGGSARETVIPPDNRTQVTNTTTYPNSAVVHINFAVPGGTSLCTGWMINANTVATAGHCVSPGTNSGFYNPASYTMTPGRNGSSAPFGTCTAKNLFSVAGWVNNGDERFDYGAIKLNCSVGNQTGWFGFFWQAASHNGNPATVQGYPGDKPTGTQWTHSGSIAATEERQVFYQIDTFGGQSGSPVWKQNGVSCTGPCAYGIHAYGFPHSTGPHLTNNHGTRITQDVFNNLISWRNAK